MPNQPDENLLAPALAQLLIRAIKQAENNFSELQELARTFTNARLSCLNRMQEIKGLNLNRDAKQSEQKEWWKDCSNGWSTGDNCPNCGKFLC